MPIATATTSSGSSGAVVIATYTDGSHKSATTAHFVEKIALACATAQKLVIPGGDYLLETDTLVVTKPIVIEGNGKGMTNLTFDAATGVGLKLSSSASGTYNALGTIRDLSIVNSNGSCSDSSSVGLLIQAANNYGLRALTERVQCSGWYYAHQIKDAVLCTVRDSLADSAYKAGFVFTGTISPDKGDNRWINNEVQSGDPSIDANAASYLIQGGSMQFITGGKVFGNAKYGVHFEYMMLPTTSELDQICTKIGVSDIRMEWMDGGSANGVAVRIYSAVGDSEVDSEIAGFNGNTILGVTLANIDTDNVGLSLEIVSPGGGVRDVTTINVHGRDCGGIRYSGDIRDTIKQHGCKFTLGGWTHATTPVIDDTTGTPVFDFADNTYQDYASAPEIADA